MLGGTDYISAATFISENQENSNIDNFPIERNPLIFKQLKNIKIPILSFAGSLEYPTYLKQSLLKEKAENAQSFTYKIIEGANHFYLNKEEDLLEIIFKWVQENFK